MVAVGYGKEKLLNNCDDKSKCTEEEHQVNRRTEFKVLGELEEGNIIKQ
jgi:outer membrane protein OmpA-like peptidoglycan-associated protein